MVYEDFSTTTTRDADATTVACWNVCPFTTCLEVCHSTDMFFVGSEDGKIWQRCRVGGRPVYPAYFHLHPETALSVPSPPVTCIALHPTFQDLLLAGESSISLRGLGFISMSFISLKSFEIWCTGWYFYYMSIFQSGKTTDP
ncbi:unnamed protein product [Dibothriocephalus latus]|uniref:Uncharacterized protein n=1 Tax=Dibothriocephalus latus TaxID=60516 RepID=A0A3P7MGZ2_DIBLA|nr:unnamed protein product [Dibothriocephalus latus]